VRSEIRRALPLCAPILAVGATFGVLAEPVMGPVAPIIMSTFVFAGAAQFAAHSVLTAGGGAGLLMNARFVPMGFAVAPALRGGRLARGGSGQAVVDASFAQANRGEGRFDRHTVFGATLVQAVAWIAGTAVGVTIGVERLCCICCERARTGRLPP
jgi:branched chain amino acid efflux pump